MLPFFLALVLLHKKTFTKTDTLRGTITPERIWWDLNYYDLDVTVDPAKKYISGKNTIRYTVLENNQVLQVDLQPPLKITKVTQKGKNLSLPQLLTHILSN